MKKILAILITIIGFNSYSQTDTSIKKNNDSFENYKKQESERFLSFREKRDQELKDFISNEENWNLITVGSKGNVKENIIKVSKQNERKPELESSSTVKEIKTPSYVENKKQKPNNEKKIYYHPLKNSKFKLTSPFGYRIHPVYKTKRFHSGIDYGANKGVPIYAIDNGTVIRAGVAKGYGNYIVIDHGNGIKSAYAHMSTMNVKKGDKIKKGNKIGGVGMSGTATGNHLHFEIIKNNKKINPEPYLNK